MTHAAILLALALGADFVNNPSNNLYSNKSNCPPGPRCTGASQTISGTEMNAVRDALLELRTHTKGAINVQVPPYSAKGDCSTDDGAALAAAFAAAAPGQTVILPATSTCYRSSIGLAPPSGVTIMGVGSPGAPEGPSGTGAHIKFDSGVTTGITVSGGTGTQFYGNAFRNLKLTLQSTAAGARLFYVKNAVELDFDRLDCWHTNASGHTSTAFAFDAADGSHWTGLVRFKGVRVSWFYKGVVNLSSTSWVTHFTFTDSQLTGLSPAGGAGSNGIEGFGNGSVIKGCNIENWDLGISSAASDGLAVQGNRFEFNGTADVKLGSGARSWAVLGNSHLSASGVYAIQYANANDKGFNTTVGWSLNGGASKSAFNMNQPMPQETWPGSDSGRTARQDWYNLNESASPLFSMQNIGSGAAYTNLFGESVTAREHDIAALEALKIGTTNTYALGLYTNNVPRLVIGAAGGVQPTRLILPPSTDRGDTSQTLTVGTDAQIQRWATALSQNRTITLSTTGASSGDFFIIVRSGLGAFTLDVGGLKTIPNSTAATVMVFYNGSAWELMNYGAH